MIFKFDRKLWETYPCEELRISLAGTHCGPQDHFWLYEKGKDISEDKTADQIETASRKERRTGNTASNL
jgi:hypothetical protein